MKFSTPTNHKTRTSINLIFFPKWSTYYKNDEFSVFTLQCTEVGENYGRKMMHGVLKAKEISVGETKICTILGEISPETQLHRQNVVGRSLNPKIQF